MKKKIHFLDQTSEKSYEIALENLKTGVLGELLGRICVSYGGRSMRSVDWAYASANGWITINSNKTATVKEWEYILSHCLLHFGFGHGLNDRENDPLWHTACDLVITQFLKDNKLGKPPAEFDYPLPFPAKDEEAVYEKLQHADSITEFNRYSTMGSGKYDLINFSDPLYFDFRDDFAESLEVAMRKAIHTATGSDAFDPDNDWKWPYNQIKAWFVSNYPLLGAIASSFTIITDPSVVARMDIPVAAVSSQLQEIYINTNTRMFNEQWKFVIAHEFLHAALRHDIRCEYRDPFVWNVACDYVINGWLVDMGIGEMPVDALYEPEYRHLSAEALYDLLAEDMRRAQKLQSGDIVYGDEAFWDSLEGLSLDQQMRSALHRGLTYHENRGRGQLPGNFVEEVRSISRPPIPWEC